MMMPAYDRRHRVSDSSLGFLSGSLEKRDFTLNNPLTDYKWTRDLPLRTDGTLATEATSFFRNTFRNSGVQQIQGKSWLTQHATVKPNITLDNEKIVTPMYPLGWELVYSPIELQKAQEGNFNLLQQLDDSLRIAYNLDADAMAYIGDDYVKAEGLFTSSEVLLTNAVDPGAGTEWVNKNSQQIINDVNAVIYAAWQNSAFTVVPRVLILPPAQFSLLIERTMSDLAEKSIMKYLPENILSFWENGAPLVIRQSKWLTGRGVGGVDRALVYTQDYKRVRFPVVQLQRQQAYYAGRYFMPYNAQFGQVEFPYAETLAYIDGI